MLTLIKLMTVAGAMYPISITLQFSCYLITKAFQQVNPLLRYRGRLMTGSLTNRFIALRFLSSSLFAVVDPSLTRISILTLGLR